MMSIGSFNNAADISDLIIQIISSLEIQKEKKNR